jgi:hypothetical protein
MIVTGMNVKAEDLNFCPRCGEKLEAGRKGKYPEEYYECSKCCTKIYIGLDGRDW